jgi:RNA polymerase sigma-70 factor (ECF subfamily)
MASEDTESYLERISQLIEQLPPKRRQVLELNIVEQKSYQEIAEALDLSVNTVKEHIRKAYAFLRDKTKDEIPKQILYFLLVKRQMANLNT